MCHKIVDSDNTLQKINVPIEEDEDNSSNKKRHYSRREQNNQDLKKFIFGTLPKKLTPIQTTYVRNQPIIISIDIGIETNYILKKQLVQCTGFNRET